MQQQLNAIVKHYFLKSENKSVYSQNKIDMFNQHLAWAKKISRLWASKRNLPKFRHDDIENDGLVGLWKASVAWKSSCGLSFKAYAQKRIVAEIIDRARSQTGSRLAHKISFDNVFSISEHQNSNKHFVDNISTSDFCLHLMRKLKGRDFKIAKMYFYENKTLSEIAEHFGLVESRVCQVIKKLCLKMKIGEKDNGN